MKNDQPYLPLVSNRSPSLWRASSAERDDLLREATLVAAVNRLVEAECNAESVLKEVNDVSYSAAVREETRSLIELHDSRLAVLRELVAQLGGSAPEPSEAQDVLGMSELRFDNPDDEESVDTGLRQLYGLLRGEYEGAVRISELPTGLEQTLRSLFPTEPAQDRPGG